MITRLEKSFDHINEFSSQVAHELKTPLAIIKGESELILSKERSVQEYQEAMRINAQEADRMRRTIEDLLLLAKLDYQPEIFQLKEIDFTKFFKEVSEQVSILAAEKGIQVVTQIPDAPIKVLADTLHLRRMFFNLLDNAIKFTIPPGIVTLKVFYKRQNVLILISDTGVGIPHQDLDKIFHKFYHYDRTGLEMNNCNGLGLSIVNSILKIHRGTIHVTSKVNVGTTFHVMLPAKKLT